MTSSMKTAPATKASNVNIKNLVVAGLAVAIIAGMGLWLANYFGMIGGTGASTDPAALDPASALQPEQREPLKKIQPQQQTEESSPEAPPPAGAHGMLFAMGPAFCSELVLLGW